MKLELRFKVKERKKDRNQPMNRIVREEVGDFVSKIRKLIDAIGAEISTRSRRSLEQQKLCLGHVFDMHSTQPMVLLTVLGPLKQVQQHSTARIQPRLQQWAQTRGRVYSHDIYPIPIPVGELPSCFLSQCLGHRVPFVSSLAVIEVGPGGLVEYLVGRPPGIGDQRGDRRREDDAPHVEPLGRFQNVERALHGGSKQVVFRVLGVLKRAGGCHVEDTGAALHGIAHGVKIQDIGLEDVDGIGIVEL